MLAGQVPGHPVGILRLTVIRGGIPCTRQNLLWTVFQGRWELIFGRGAMVGVLSITSRYRQREGHQRERHLPQGVEESPVHQPDGDSQCQDRGRHTTDGQLHHPHKGLQWGYASQENTHKQQGHRSDTHHRQTGTGLREDSLQTPFQEG